MVVIAEGHKYHSLGQTVVGISPPLEAYIMPSDTMKASPQGREFQFRYSSVPLGLLSRVHGVFISRAYLPHLGATKGNSP